MNSIVSGIYRHFPALGHRHYRRFFYAQLVSLVGTWMQQASVPWLVNDLTHSPYKVGLVTALSSLPILLFTVPAGVFADRRSKKDILVCTQILLLVNAGLFTAFSAAGMLGMGMIIGLSIMRGGLMAVDTPVRQSFFREIVDRRALPSAIALNSGMFNAARIVGPALAGLFLAISPTVCFLLNAISFLGVIVVLFQMRPEFTVSSDEKSGLASLIDGFRYTRGNASIRSVFFLLAVCSIFGWSYTSLLPTIAERVFRVPSQGYGVLLSACGVGALIGAIAVGRLKDGRNLPKFLIGGWFVFIVALAGFGLSGTYAAGLVAIFGIGLGLSTLNVAGNSLVQTLVTDAYRGRVMGLYMFLWAGLGTVGSYVVGRMAEVIGMGTTLIVNSVICLAAVVIVRSRIAAAARDITLHVHVSSVAPHPLPLAPEALPLAAETRPAIALEEQDAS